MLPVIAIILAETDFLFFDCEFVKKINLTLSTLIILFLYF